MRFTSHIVGDGESLFRELSRVKLEGMVAKRMDSSYVSGRTTAWLKIKTRAGKRVGVGMIFSPVRQDKQTNLHYLIHFWNTFSHSEAVLARLSMSDKYLSHAAASAS